MENELKYMLNVKINKIWANIHWENQVLPGNYANRIGNRFKVDLMVVFRNWKAQLGGPGVLVIFLVIRVKSPTEAT